MQHNEFFYVFLESYLTTESVIYIFQYVYTSMHVLGWFLFLDCLKISCLKLPETCESAYRIFLRMKDWYGFVYIRCCNSASFLSNTLDLAKIRSTKKIPKHLLILTAASNTADCFFSTAFALLHLLTVDNILRKHKQWVLQWWLILDSEQVSNGFFIAQTKPKVCSSFFKTELVKDKKNERTLYLNMQIPVGNVFIPSYSILRKLTDCRDDQWEGLF